MSKTEMTANALIHPALNFFTQRVTVFFWVSSVQTVTFCKFVGKQEKSLLSPCVSLLSVVSVCERHATVENDFTVMYLTVGASFFLFGATLYSCLSVRSFLSALPRHVTPPPLPLPTAENHNQLFALSVLHFATAALVKYTPWFFVQTTLQFISSLLSSLAICYFSCYFSYLQKKKRKKMGCAINPCSFPMEPLVKYCSFFTFWYFILHIADFRV